MTKNGIQKKAQEIVDKMTIEEIKAAAVVGVMTILQMKRYLEKSIIKSLNKDDVEN